MFHTGLVITRVSRSIERTNTAGINAGIYACSTP